MDVFQSRSSPAGLQLLNHGWAPSGAGTTDQTGWAVDLSGDAFADNQYAEAAIKSIAPPLATMTISAALQVSGNTTYTYILTSGTPIFVGMDIVVAAMQNAENEGDFVVTGIGAGTFTVANASGITEAGSSGTGTASSDSLCGLIVRGTADGQNGYFTLIGTNSGEAGGTEDSRVYTVELWVLENGVPIFLVATEPVPTTVPDSPGDVYRLTATGTTITLTKNGVLVPGFSVTDVHGQIGGYPGIATQSLSNATPGVGNAGTIWTNWTGSDGVEALSSGWIPRVADSFSGTGSLNNPPWQITSYSPGVLPTVSSSGACTSPSGSENATAEYTGRTWANDQASECTLLDMPDGAGYLECTVRNNAPGSPSLNNYILFVTTSTGIGTSGTWTIFKTIAGSLTSLATGSVTLFSVGDVFTLQVKGSTLTGLQNGTTLGTASDSAIASGTPGFLIFTSHISKWTGYEFVSKGSGSSSEAGIGVLDGKNVMIGNLDGVNPAFIVSPRTSIIGTNLRTRIIG